MSRAALLRALAREATVQAATVAAGRTPVRSPSARRRSPERTRFASRFLLGSAVGQSPADRQVGSQLRKWAAMFTFAKQRMDQLQGVDQLVFEDDE